MKTQLFSIGVAIVTAISTDLITWLQARRKARKAGKELPAFELERLGERFLIGLTAGLAGAGISGIGAE
jgi:hypothetical protein